MRLFRPKYLCAAAVATCAVLASGAPRAETLPLIDAHSQFDRDVEPDNVLRWLDKAGIARVILSTRRGRSWRDLSRLAQDHPDRIVASVRTKGSDFANNTRRYRRRLQKQLADPAFRAMAEVMVWHAEKGKGRAAEVILPMDAPQVTAALRAALERGWPFVVHIEFRSAKAAGDYDRVMTSLEKLLRAHPDHPFALTHLGQLSAAEARRLIAAHRNIHFLTSHANEVITRESGQPWTVMVKNDALVPAWRALVIAHPERFILAFDNVWEHHWSDLYVKQAASWRKALGRLPAEAAQAVAHGNAARLWRLAPPR